MRAVGVRSMKDTITYWATSGATDRFGKPVFSAPVALIGRWEDRIENVQGKTGDVYISKARVFLKDQIAIDGYLFRGTSIAVDPTVVQNAGEVQALGSMPDLRSTQRMYVAYL